MPDYKLYKEAIRRTPSALLPLQSLAGNVFPFEKMESFTADIHQTDKHGSHCYPDATGEETKSGLHGASDCGEGGHEYQPDICGSRNFPDCSNVSQDLLVERERNYLTVPHFQTQTLDPWVKNPGTVFHADGCQSMKKQKMKVWGKDQLSGLSTNKQSAIVLNNHKCVTLLIQQREQNHSSSFPGNQVRKSTKEQIANQMPPLQNDFQEDNIHTSTSTISSGVIHDLPSSESRASMNDVKDLAFHAQDFQMDWEASKGTQELQPGRDSEVEWKVNRSTYQEIKVIIRHEEDEMADIETKRKDDKEEKPGSLKEWFKYPTFYKLSFAFMCSRIVENTMYAYFPIYLVDTLKMDKAAIAYLPLVVLISGLFASVATKRLNKILGYKWTYCMASLTVMSVGAWFYVIPLSVSNMVYIPASLLGGGCCVMLVTSMALIAEMLRGNKMSSATVFNATTLFGKMATGTSVVLTQQFYPKDSVDEDASGNYVRFVFGAVLGAAGLCGLLAVIVFIPASMKCRKVVRTSDASTQTHPCDK